MRIFELLSEGDVVAFPSHLAKRDQLMTRLDKASRKYKKDGSIKTYGGTRFFEPYDTDKWGDAPSDPALPSDFQSTSYFVANPEGAVPVVHAQFDSYEEAEKAIPEIEMKTGLRGLIVRQL